MKKTLAILAAIAFCLAAAAPKTKANTVAPERAQRWTEEKANAWYADQQWPCGCVFMPSYAGTPVELWGEECFNPEVLDRELGYAEGLGFNVIRLFLADIVWQNDHDGFMYRLEKTGIDAGTDKPTVINLSNHTFFNMKGGKGGYVMDQLFQVEADQCIQNNEQMCPDKILPVEGSPFDFREPHRVDYRLDMPNEHLTIMKGMSACWCIRGYDGTLRKAATLYDKESGRGVETWTTEPALLTYTARGFNGKLIGKDGGDSWSKARLIAVSDVSGTIYLTKGKISSK